ncbi:MAG: hypothetical protein JOY84_23455 [Curvibacter sp.]|nr:hypothetical protein [Curvibacter sp.]
MTLRFCRVTTPDCTKNGLLPVVLAAQEIVRTTLSLVTVTLLLMSRAITWVMVTSVPSWMVLLPPAWFAW